MVVRLLRPARHQGADGKILLGVVVGLILHALMYAPQAAFFSELFGTSVRYTGASVGYQLASIFAGALAPIIALKLLGRRRRTATPPRSRIYVTIASVITIIAVLFAKETRGTSLRHDRVVRGAHERTESRPRRLIPSHPDGPRRDPAGRSVADRWFIEVMSHVWYVSYGSNMSAARLACYLEGGVRPGGTRANPGARDRTPPARDIPVDLPGHAVLRRRVAAVGRRRRVLRPRRPPAGPRPAATW